MLFPETPEQVILIGFIDFMDQMCEKSKLTMLRYLD